MFILKYFAMVAGATRFPGSTEFIQSHRKGGVNMLKAQHNGIRFEIVEDNPDVGFYLYVYERNRCIRDVLQNDIQTCIEIAFEDYDAPKDGWHSVGEDSSQVT